MYKRIRFNFPEAIEYEESSSTSVIPGGKRAARQKATPEQVAAANQRAKEKKCRRKLRAHFRKDDYYITLTYRKDDRPEDMEEAKKDVRKFLRRIRTEYKKQKVPLKWIANIECGTRGSWHVHMVINRIRDGDQLIAKAWDHGKVTNQLLYDSGKFRKLAAYLTKTPRTDPRIKAAHYMAARNLPIPKPKKKVINRRDFLQVRTPAGWYLEKESCLTWINPITGQRHNEYTFLKCKRD